MDFRVGDRVVHCVYGLGEIVGLEERDLAGQNNLYYVVKIQGVTVYVPANGDAKGRLRLPTPEREFKKLFVILSGRGEPLSEDRLERKAELRKKLDNGKAETNCQVIRDLSAFQQKKALNEEDKQLLKRASNSLLGEWGYSLSVPLAQAELELHRMLWPRSETVAG